MKLNIIGKLILKVTEVEVSNLVYDIKFLCMPFIIILDIEAIRVCRLEPR